MASALIATEASFSAFRQPLLKAFVVTLQATNASGSDFKDVSFYIAHALSPFVPTPKYC